MIILLGHWGRKQPVNKVMVTTSAALFLLITTHWALSIARVFGAFIYSADNHQGTLLYILTIEDPTYVARSLVFVAICSLGDAILIYRLYIVWGRNIWVCIPSIICYMGYIASGIAASVLVAQFTPAKSSSLPKITRWIQGGGIASLVTNIYSTTMIAFHIWQSQRRFTGTDLSQNRVSRALRIFIESALLYTTATTVSIGCQFGNSVWVGPSLDVISPIVGISFSLILVRLRLGISIFAAPTGFSAGDSSTMGVLHGRSNDSMPRLAIQMQHMVTRDHDCPQAFEKKQNFDTYS